MTASMPTSAPMPPAAAVELLPDRPPPRPPAHWALSLGALLLTLLPGLVAVVYSHRVGTAYAAGDVRMAEHASRQAQTWGALGCLLGVFVVIAAIANLQ